MIGVAKESKYYYSINFWTQTFCFALCYSYVFIDFLIFLTISSHILVELGTINEMCKDLGGYEEQLSKKYFERELSESTPDIEVIDLPDDDHSKTKSKEMLKLILDRHVKIVEIIKTSSNFYFISILMNEANTFACIGFVFYLIAIYGGNTYLALGALFIIPQYYMISLIGSRILESGNDIAKTLYDSNWLYLKPKERKMMCVIMELAQKPHTLSVGGFANVSLERFNVVRLIF